MIVLSPSLPPAFSPLPFWPFCPTDTPLWFQKRPLILPLRGQHVPLSRITAQISGDEKTCYPKSTKKEKRLNIWNVTVLFFCLSVDHRFTLTQIDTPLSLSPLQPTPFQRANGWGYGANYNSLDSFSFSSVVLFLSRPTTDPFWWKKKQMKNCQQWN